MKFQLELKNTALSPDSHELSHFKLSVRLYTTPKTFHFCRHIQKVKILIKFYNWEENGTQLRPLFKIKSTGFRLYLFWVERGFIEGSLRVHWGLGGVNLNQPSLNPLSTLRQFSLINEWVVLKFRSYSGGMNFTKWDSSKKCVKITNQIKSNNFGHGKKEKNKSCQYGGFDSRC